MKIRYSAAVAVLALSGCKTTTPKNNSEVMIDTSTNRKQEVAAPGLQRSQADQLGTPTLSGREQDSGE